ncbi:hypothetical protein BJY04DRAFT_184262 [Aspergillus karnatakaensis]|uniref:uncharacterized protein n=1 Tax=Aspergillus karnatakaensis TaxID=1810916 RepID=UPI003CCE17BD
MSATMYRYLASLLPLALLPLARAQTVQDLWNSPDYPDYTTNYTAGETVEISWERALATQFQFFCEECDISGVDLWVTASDYSSRLAAGINVNTTLSYDWDIDLSDSDVEANIDWTFRFLPADAPWGSGSQEISSAKFNLLTRPETPSPTPTPTSSTTSTTTTSTNGPTATDDPTTTPTPDPDPASGSDDGLSTGAKAGIGVGVSAGALILIALAFLLWRRFRALPPKAGAAAGGPYNNLQHAPPSDGGSHYVQGQGYYAPPPVVDKNKVAPVPLSELQGGYNVRELDAGVDAQRPPAELDGGFTRR